MTDHPTTEAARPPGRCWCGHVRVTHRPWAAGELCTRLTCGCRHYAEKRRGGEVIENRAAALPAQEPLDDTARENWRDAVEVLRDALEVQITGCDHQGIGKPGCRICDPRTYPYVARLRDEEERR